MSDEPHEPALYRLSREIAACRLCRDSPKGRKPLPHEPRPVAILSATARILIAGQAPGLRVHETGIPFNDASGNRLRQWLGVSREQFYDPRNFAILPMGFCFPGYDQKGADLPPRPECAPAWRRQTLALMPQIDLVLAIGLYAQKWHLPNSGGNLTENVENWTRKTPDKSKLQVVPLPHPSWRNTGWLKKHPWFEVETRARLRGLINERLL